MPISEPLKVHASPKTMSTESWITPGGGRMKPAITSPTPTRNTMTAMASWIFNLTFSMTVRNQKRLEEISSGFLLVLEAPFLLEQFRNRVALPFGVERAVVADIINASVKILDRALPRQQFVDDELSDCSLSGVL